MQTFLLAFFWAYMGLQALQLGTMYPLLTNCLSARGEGGEEREKERRKKKKQKEEEKKIGLGWSRRGMCKI